MEDEVRGKVADTHVSPPTDAHALTFLTLAISRVVHTEFPSNNGGKTAIYMFRGVAQRGTDERWSKVRGDDGDVTTALFPDPLESRTMTP